SGGLIVSVSALTTLWSASNGVSAIQVGLEQIAGISKSGMKGKPKAIVFTLIIILFLPVLLLTQLLQAPLISLLDSFSQKLPLATFPKLIINLLESSGPVAVLLVFFIILLLYCWLPKEKRTVQSQLPGTIFSLAATVVFTMAFSFFMGHFWKASSIYGSLAAVFLTAMWLKFTVMIIFYGAALNEALVETKNS
ncbi:MAG: YihY/virulence factor BrkB family protein, partial [Solobacterium sp.]|nr:YihY/virulence factor BrkB family protein [Solobacterium sp.]